MPAAEPAAEEASAAKPGDLPPGWVEERDPVSGRLYYLNEELGESSWHRPLVSTQEVEELYQSWEPNSTPLLGDYNTADREASPSECCLPQVRSIGVQCEDEAATALASEQARRAAEEEAATAAEEEAERLAAEASRVAAEEEAARLAAAEEEAARLALEEEARVLAEEEAAQKLAQEEAERKAKEEAEAEAEAEREAHEEAELKESGTEPDAYLTRLVLLGFGAVNQELVRLILQKQQKLLPRRFAVVGVADSQGARYARGAHSLDMQGLLDHKQSGESVSTFGGGSGCSDGLDVLDRLGETGYDVLVDGSLMDLETGGVGLEAARKALSRGNAAVLANKAPLVTAFDELSKYGASRLFFSATVCGGCPVVNIGRRDLGFAAEFTEVAGVFNSTSNFILKELGDGNSFDSALCTAQELGIAEADPSKDIDG